MSHRRIHSSASNPEYPERDDLYDGLRSRQEAIDGHMANAQEHLNRAEEESKALAARLRETGLAGFITKYCQNMGDGMKTVEFDFNDEGNLELKSNFMIRDAKGEGNPKGMRALQQLTTTLMEMGIPRDNVKKILVYEPYHLENEAIDHRPSEKVEISVDEKMIDALIEQAVEKRFQPIRQKYMIIEGRRNSVERLGAMPVGERDDLQVVSDMIDKATGEESLPGSLEPGAKFTEILQNRVKDDIRRAVIGEVLGPKIVQSQEIDKQL